MVQAIPLFVSLALEYEIHNKIHKHSKLKIIGD